MTAGATGDAPALELSDVTKRYGGRAVLGGVSLAVRPGEVVALLGPNGAGKTTAVEILEGYRRADAGQARLLGVESATAGPATRARVGIMLQDGGLDPRATVRDLVRLYRRFHADGREPDRLLVDLGLEPVAGSRVRRLSGGERQRLSLAIALVGDPEVLILDEPTAGLDPEGRRATRALVAALRAEGRAILLTTHDLGDVERLADRVAILHGGRIVAEGPPGEVAAASRPLLRFRLPRPLTPDEARDLELTLGRGRGDGGPGDGGPGDEARGGGRLEAEAGAAPGSYRLDGRSPDPALVAAIAAWCAAADLQLAELRTTTATLEERYLELTGDRGVEDVE